MRASRVMFGACVLGLTQSGCSAVAVGGPSPTVPGAEPATRIPRTTGSGKLGESNTMRYVCRGHVPSGWIAVDYIDDAEGCATSRARNAVAVIVPLRVTTIGATLEVCAEERIPRGWQEVQMIAGDSRCPPSKPVESTRPSIREIRRLQ